MKHRIKSLTGFTIRATDGEIGKVTDFYFDDITWTIRYLVVETGNWLLNRKVLITPEALLQCDWENETFPVNLTKGQIEKSPNTDTEQPVSRQQEIELYAHYPWINYWAGGMGTTGMLTPMSSVPMEEAVKKSEKAPDAESHGDPNLRSAKSVEGYTVHVLDDTIGDVEDFLVDDTSWTILYMIVDTGNWFPGKKVVISPDRIKEIDWETSAVIIDTSIAHLKNSPGYDPEQEFTKVYTLS